MSNLYVIEGSGIVVNSEYYVRYMALLKLLYKLQIISEDQVLKIAIKFIPLFV